MIDNASDIVFGSRVVRTKFSGLLFYGGNNQLHIGNNNTDKGQILIDGAWGFASLHLPTLRSLRGC